MAMNLLGSGLSAANYIEEALSVRETELSTLRRIGVPEHQILVVQSNLASTYEMLGQIEPALSLQQGVYFGFLKLYGEEHQYTLSLAINYADLLKNLNRFEEAKSLLHKTIPVARRALGDSNDTTLRMRRVYARTLYQDDGATLDDLREAVATLEDAGRVTRRVLGDAHPFTLQMKTRLRSARAALGAREGGDVASIREAVAAMTAGDA